MQGKLESGIENEQESLVQPAWLRSIVTHSVPCFIHNADLHTDDEDRVTSFSVHVTPNRTAITVHTFAGVDNEKNNQPSETK